MYSRALSEYSQLEHRIQSALSYHSVYFSRFILTFYKYYNKYFLKSQLGNLLNKWLRSRESNSDLQDMNLTCYLYNTAQYRAFFICRRKLVLHHLFILAVGRQLTGESRKRVFIYLSLSIYIISNFLQKIKFFK